MISKQQYEAQLQQIFRLLLDNKIQEEIARELNIATRSVARYYQRIENRYGEIQRQKTYDTIFLEPQLFENRMLTLYKALENQVISSDNNISGAEKAKYAEVAANIAIDVLKMESEGIKAFKQGHVLMAEAAAATAKTARTLSTSTVSDSDMIEELENRC